MKKTKMVSVILALVSVFAFTIMRPSAFAAAYTPTVTVSISYDVSSYVSGLAGLTNGATYYILADDASHTTAATTVKPSSAYWKLVGKGAAAPAVEGLYPNPGDLISVSGSAIFSNQGSVGKVNEIAIRFSSDDLGPATTGAGNGDTSLLSGSIYNVYTANGWAEAEAKVSNLYYTSFSDAVNSANSGGLGIILLKSVTLSSTVYTNISISSSVSIYCCNSSRITVADEGTLILSGAVFDSTGTKTAVYLTDGGTVNDSNGNIINASLTSGDATVSGTGTTLTAQTADGTSHAVRIKGSFAQLTGKNFALTDATTINSTGTDGAYITGSGFPLTVNGGNVHTIAAFDISNRIYLSGGNLYVEMSAVQETYITGTAPYNGNVFVSSGTAQIYGQITNLNVIGKTDFQLGGIAMLYGTAANATVTGASTLTLTSESDSVKAVVTGDITGSADASGTYGKLNITSTVYNVSKVYAKGCFAQISGVAWMSGDLTIKDASSTEKIDCNGFTYTLEILGAGNNASIPVQLEGTFGTVKISNVNIIIKNGVTIKSGLNVSSASISVQNGVNVGSQSSVANCVISDGIVSFINSSVYAKFTGTGSANSSELHIADGCDATSIVGVMGEFKSITGHVHTCGSLILDGTLDNGTYGVNKAVITGGMTFYNDDGMTWSLQLKDSASSTNVELGGGKNQSGSVVSAGFKSITVNDNTGNSEKVSLTMHSYSGATYPVNTGAAADGDTYGLYVSGDAATTVSLSTNNIYGTNYGVYLVGVTATITGSDASTLKTITGNAFDGVYLEASSLTMSNYAITGNIIGVDMVKASHAVITNVTSAGSNTVNGVGIRIGQAGDSASSSLALETATVSGYNGIEVSCGSSLTLKNRIEVTGVSTGINVIDGTVTDESDLATGVARTSTVTGTGSSGYAMFVEKGTVALNGYTFSALVTGGYGVATGNGVVSVTLSDSNNLGAPGAYIWGNDTGALVGTSTVMTISDYNCYGADKSNPQSVSTGNAGARVYGTLQLSGINTILGGVYGIYSEGTVTNFHTASSWTADENAAGASAQGSGSILSGCLTASSALRAQGGRVTLGNYSLISVGINNVNSCGLYAAKSASGNSTVYLVRDAAYPTECSVTGGTGYGVYMNGATVTINNMLISTKSAYSAQVDSGILNLGTGVTLGNLNVPSGATVVGNSSGYAELHVTDLNTAISAEGQFKSLTGYVATSNDLIVIGTGNENAYNTTDYTAAATILGCGSLHNLILGSDKVKAVLAAGGVFGSVKITGESATQQDITVAGGLSVINSYASYALYASYADIIFASGSSGSSGPSGSFTRNFEASAAGATGVVAITGAKLCLTDTVNISGVGCGLSLSGTAVVTDMQKDNSWVTAFSTDGTNLSHGLISASNGNGVNLTGASVLLLGGHGISGTSYAINATGNSADSGVYLKAGSITGEKTLSATAAPNIIVNIDTLGQVNLTGYTANESSGCVAVVNVSSGTVTLDGGSYSGLTQCRALVIAADTDGAPNVTLKGKVTLISGLKGDNGCVDLTGSDKDHKAILSIVDAEIKAATKSGVSIGDFAEVSMAGGSITGEYLESSKALYGVLLTKATSAFTMSDGTIGFKNDQSASTGISVYVGDGSASISGGTVGLSGGVYSYIGVDSFAKIAISGGSVYGTEYALKQESGSAWISGGTLDTEDTSKNDIVIYSSNNLWITGGTVNGIVEGDATTHGLYIKPDIASTVYVDGKYSSMTGHAWVSGSGSLTIENTTDAENALNTGVFANGTATANNKLALTGDSGTTKAVVLKSGAAELCGFFGVITIAEATGSPAEVTITGDTSIAGGSLVDTNGELTVAPGETLTIGTGVLTIKGAATVNGSILGQVTGDKGQLNIANDSGTDVSADGTFSVITSLNSKNRAKLAGKLTATSTGSGFVSVFGTTPYDFDLPDGTAELSGVFNELTVGNKDGTAAAVTFTDNTSLAAVSAVHSDGSVTVSADKTPKELTGVLTVEGTATVNGSISGKVTGEKGILNVANKTGTNVAADGTFSAVTSLDSSNTVTLSGNLTVGTTGSGGSAYIVGDTADGLTVTAGTVYVKGLFNFVNGSVILFNDTTINGSDTGSTKVSAPTVGTGYALTLGGSSAVTVADGVYSYLTAGGNANAALENGTYEKLTVGGSSAVTVNNGQYAQVTLNGGTLTLVPDITLLDIKVVSGDLKISKTLHAPNNIIVGDTKKATILTKDLVSISGELKVKGDKILEFPSAVSVGSFTGWSVLEKNEIISAITGGYTFLNGEYIKTNWFFQASAASTAGYTIEYTKEATSGSGFSGTSEQLGSVSVSKDFIAGSNVTLTVKPGVSFRVGTVTVTDAKSNKLSVADNGDGTYTFKMPSQNVKVAVDYAPLLGEEQTTPPVEHSEKSQQNILFNSEAASIMAYNINGSNYFKLRDVALLLNGKASQFAIGFSSGGIVSITTGAAYEPVGSESIISEDQSSTCVVSSWKVEVNGIVRYLKCYNIAGNNYFQLRELAELLGVGVSYDAAANSVNIAA